MSTQEKEKKQRWKILFYLYLLIILLSLFTVASYTWFSLSQTPRVSDMYMFINTQSGLELATSPDSEEWVLQLDYRNIVDETAPLRPVTWSEKDQRFYAASYGFDGRLTDQWEPLSDERHANKDNLDGYYVKATFYARSGQDVSVFLSPAVEVDEGVEGSGTYLIGTPVWDAEEIVHSNGGQGAECAVRIGIRITKLDSNGNPLEEESDFYIYEPNSDGHIDGSTGYVPTPSIDGTETLIPEEWMILQTASTWTEAYPVQREVVIKDLGEFTTPVDLFELKADEKARIDIYIWLEGQDVDCTNEISKAQIMASIQFGTETGGGSGLQPIE